MTIFKQGGTQFDNAIDACADWIRSWGNGGGCYSLGTHINDLLGSFDGDKCDLDNIKHFLLENTCEFPCMGQTCDKHIHSNYGDLIEIMIGTIKVE